MGIVIHTNKRDIRLINGFIITSYAVIISAIENIVVQKIVITAVTVKRKIFIIGDRSKVKRGAAADKHTEIGEDRFNILIDRTALAAVRIKCKFIFYISSRTKQGKSDTAGSMILYTVPFETV